MCVQTAIQRLCMRLQFSGEDSDCQQLVASTLEPLGLIMSLLVCAPTRAPQFTQLSMVDGSLQDQQRPKDAAAVLVRNPDWAV